MHYLNYRTVHSWSRHCCMTRASPDPEQLSCQTSHSTWPSDWRSRMPSASWWATCTCRRSSGPTGLQCSRCYYCCYLLWVWSVMPDVPLICYLYIVASWPLSLRHPMMDRVATWHPGNMPVENVDISNAITDYYYSVFIWIANFHRCHSKLTRQLENCFRLTQTFIHCQIPFLSPVSKHQKKLQTDNNGT